MESRNWECPLCHELLYEPVVLACGHSFCKHCVRALFKAHRRQTHTTTRPHCPCCRKPITTTGGRLSPCPLFSQLLQHSFPDEWAAREAELSSPSSSQSPGEASSSDVSDDGRLGALPLFLLEPLLPRQRIQLHVFELKYRRMFDSIVAGDQRFGMICSQVLSAGTGRYLCVEVEVEHYQRLIDGRYNVIGKARELVCVSGVSLSDDGYLVGDVVHDWTTVVTDNEPHTPVDEVTERIDRWKSLVRPYERMNGHLELILSDLLDFPAHSSLTHQALWISALINPIPPLGVAREVRPQVLMSHSGREQYDIAVEALVDSIRELEALQRSPARRAQRLLLSLLSHRATFLAIVLLLAVLLERALRGGDSTSSLPEDSSTALPMEQDQQESAGASFFDYFKGHNDAGDATLVG